jgi:hypothetical protein
MMRFPVCGIILMWVASCTQMDGSTHHRWEMWRQKPNSMGELRDGPSSGPTNGPRGQMSGRSSSIGVVEVAFFASDGSGPVEKYSVGTGITNGVALADSDFDGDSPLDMDFAEAEGNPQPDP